MSSITKSIQNEYGLPFFPGSCFDRQIFQCIVSIITIWTPANYLRSKKHGRV